MKKFDIGETFSGKKSGKYLVGWDEPQEYTPKIDNNYIPDGWLADLLIGFMHNMPLYVFGPQGTGKTAGVKQIAARLNWPVYEVTGHSRLEFPELCGAFHVKDGNMIWHDGPLTSAMRNGGVLLVNEQSLLDPSTAAGLNSILDGAPLFIPELNEYIKRNENFRYVATDNSNGSGDFTGTYAGVLRQNAALMSRFMMVRATYLPKKTELQMLLKRVPGLPNDIAEKMVEVANIIRGAFIGNTDTESSPTDDIKTQLSVTMSPRDLIRWGELTIAYEAVANKGFSPMLYALDRAFVYRVPRGEDKAIHGIVQRVM